VAGEIAGVQDGAGGVVRGVVRGSLVSGFGRSYWEDFFDAHLSAIISPMILGSCEECRGIFEEKEYGEKILIIRRNNG